MSIHAVHVTTCGGGSAIGRLRAFSTRRTRSGRRPLGDGFQAVGQRCPHLRAHASETPLGGAGEDEHAIRHRQTRCQVAGALEPVDKRPRRATMRPATAQLGP
jgi:hypothetical protein